MFDQFVAIDFETANADLASICQVGIATFQQGGVVDEWQSLVDPEDYFDWMNIDIHGIDEDMVADAPTFPEIFDLISKRLQDQIVVCHTAFDRTAMSQVTDKYSMPSIQCTWLDSARVVRRTWPDFAWSGYGLANVCDFLGIKFKHHNALEDAKAAGEVLVHAINKSGLSLNDWLKRVNQPIDPTTATSIKRAGNPEGSLYGEVMVFTGALTMPRRVAADLASKIGCEVATTVKKTTSLLVVGDQDIAKLAGHEKSSKHRKAEEMIAKGHQIRILRESDFLRLIEIEETKSDQMATGG